MGYEENPSVLTPPDDTVVWRYMNFIKFIDLLEKSRLWFARADLLDDPREGGFTKLELEQFHASAYPAVAERNLRLFDSLRREHFVNCWTESSDSMAMWDLYANSTGVAVRSTIRRLKSAVSAASEKIHIGSIEYVNWESTALWPNNVFGMFVRKAFGFVHEKEIRMIIWVAGSSDPTNVEAGDLVQLKNYLLRVLPAPTTPERQTWNRLFNAEWNRASLKRALVEIVVAVNVEELIEEVIVGPRNAQARDLIETVVQQRYRLKKTVRLSDLSR